MNMIIKIPGKLNFATVLIFSSLVMNTYADDEVYRFNDNFIMGNHNKVDLSKYTSSSIAEGVYSLDVYTNGKWKGRYELTVDKQKDGTIGVCYDKEMLIRFGLSPSQLNKSLEGQKGFCGTLKEWNGEKEISGNINKAAMRLDITVPQMYEDKMYREFVDPSLWDKGIPALNIGWNGNIWNSHYSSNGGSDYTTGYLGLNINASVGGWLLKHTGNVNWAERKSVSWESHQTYLQRPIPGLKSMVSAGQVSGSGEFFDTLTVRGISLKTDTEMFPDIMTNFVPEIRGVAQSNALVTVKQNGRVIHETTVTPGPFLLTDVYPTGYGAALEVTVKETNGMVSSFVVPYNAGAKLLYPGMFKYEVLAGKPDSLNYANKPIMYQASAKYGFNNLLTGYAGFSGFEGYQSFLVGAGLNTGIGAFSLDATTSKFKKNNISDNGNMYRLSFTRNFSSTDTSLSFVGLKYSEKGFYSTGTALDRVNNYKGDGFEKSNIGVTLSQHLGDDWGRLYLSGRLIDRWDSSSKEKQYQLSYSNNYGKVLYGVSLQRIKTNYRGSNETDNRIGVNFSIPLDFSNHNTSMLTAYSTFNNQSHTNTNIGMSGSIGENYDFNYGVTTSIGDSKDVSLNAGYKGQYGNINGAFSQGSDYRQFSINGSGSVVAHSGGVIFTPETGDTIGIIEAKGAKGAKIASSLNSKVDGSGYAVVSSLRPYHVNSIEVDPKGSADNVYFNETMKQVAPYKGAVVKLSFDTEVQDNLTFRGKLKNGKPFPFGASIYNTANTEIGVVGQGGTVFIKNASMPKAVLKWDNGTCVFILPKENSEVTCD